MERRPLTRTEIARLGGLTAADNLSPEQRTARAMKAGNAAREKLGRAHYMRMALMRHGRLPRPKEGSAVKAAAKTATGDAQKKARAANSGPNSANGAK